jgi:hypothetical protein
MAQATIETKPAESLKGWFMAGANPAGYKSSIDKDVSHSNSNAALMTNKKAGNSGHWGTLMQQMAATEYLNKRVKMTLWLKTEEVEGWVAPWMRVDDSNSDTVSFDNTCQGHIRGTNDWSKHTLVLNVPETSGNIAYGVMLGGAGKVWIDDVQFEAVDANVPTTDCRCMKGIARAAEKKSKTNNIKIENPRPLPKGWSSQKWNEVKSWSVVNIGVDQVKTFDGKKIACVEVIEADPGAGAQLYQIMRCEGLRGKRVRLSVQLKCEKIKNSASFCIDVIGPQQTTLASDNMANRLLKGSKDWKKHDLVVDIPDNALNLKMSARVFGVGTLMFADLNLEEVDLDVPKTDDYSEGCRGIWWQQPINLDFKKEEESGYLHQSCKKGVTPKGWLCCSDPALGYEVGSVLVEPGKTGAACLKAIGNRDAADNALIFQKFDGKVYRGKTVRFTAFTKTRNVTGECGIALSIMDTHQNEIFRDDALEYDSNSDHDWAKREIVMKVPEHAGVLLISLILSGGGTAWMKDLSFEVVEGVPLTKSKWKPAPVNLDLSQVY